MTCGAPLLAVTLAALRIGPAALAALANRIERHEVPGHVTGWQLLPGQRRPDRPVNRITGAGLAGQRRMKVQYADG